MPCASGMVAARDPAAVASPVAVSSALHSLRSASKCSNTIRLIEPVIELPLQNCFTRRSVKRGERSQPNCHNQQRAFCLMVTMGAIRSSKSQRANHCRAHDTAGVSYRVRASRMHVKAPFNQSVLLPAVQAANRTRRSLRQNLFGKVHENINDGE